jgi:hypothetical protein
MAVGEIKWKTLPMGDPAPPPTVGIEVYHVIIQNLQLASDAIKFYKKPGKLSVSEQLKAESDYWSQVTNSSPIKELQDMLDKLANSNALAKQAAVAVEDDSSEPDCPKEDDY